MNSNLKIINKKNLYHNLDFIKFLSNNNFFDKKHLKSILKIIHIKLKLVRKIKLRVLNQKHKAKEICVLVKANAYGHETGAIVALLKDKVKWFGVANETEALYIKKLAPKNKVLVVGKSSNFTALIKNKIDFTIDSFYELKTINKILKNNKTLCVNIHIAINTGMNRIGVKTIKDFKQMLSYIQKNNQIKLKGVFTHCFDADSKTSHFYEQMKTFKNYVNILNANNINNILIHIGGSYCLNHDIPNFVNMLRVGFFLYGYGHPNLKPVMKIVTKVSKVTKCSKGEFVGYGSTNLKSSENIATIPMGYFDGIPRQIGNGLLKVKIKNKYYKVIGNICMDMFMVKVNKDIKTNDKIIVFDNAEYFAKQINTSPYEILTNFGKSRTKYLIK